MNNRTVIVAGATGLVGRAILAGLLADATVAAAHSLGRRKPAAQHPKLTSHVVDFTALPALPAAQELYLALGTTIAVAGSQQAFRAVDHDASLAAAVAAQAAGVTQVGVVSAMGADPHSRVFYNRVKGELEEALAIARPSLLAGDRAQLGPPARRGEEWGFALGKALGFLIPENYRPIEASAVAAALLREVPGARGKHVLVSGAMQPAA